MIRKTLSLLFCLALTTSLISKRRFNDFLLLKTSEGDLKATNEYCA